MGSLFAFLPCYHEFLRLAVTASQASDKCTEGFQFAKTRRTRVAVRDVQTRELHAAFLEPSGSTYNLEQQRESVSWLLSHKTTEYFGVATRSKYPLTGALMKSCAEYFSPSIKHSSVTHTRFSKVTHM